MMSRGLRRRSRLPLHHCHFRGHCRRRRRWWGWFFLSWTRGSGSIDFVRKTSPNYMDISQLVQHGIFHSRAVNVLLFRPQLARRQILWRVHLVPGRCKWDEFAAPLENPSGALSLVSTRTRTVSTYSAIYDPLQIDNTKNACHAEYIFWSMLLLICSIVLYTEKQDINLKKLEHARHTRINAPQVIASTTSSKWLTPI